MEHSVHTELDQVLVFFADAMRRQMGKHLRELVLFGSRARGDATAESDYDCLVVVDRVTRLTKSIIDDAAGEVLYRFGAVLSAFPVSEEARRKRKYSPLFINAAREGIPL